MTLAEKILAAHSGKEKVSPGEFINVRVDLVFTQEGMAYLVIEALQKGYIYNGRVIRPAKVKVSKRTPKDRPSGQAENRAVE